MILGIDGSAVAGADLGGGEVVGVGVLVEQVGVGEEAGAEGGEEAIASPIGLTVDESVIQAALERFKAEALDGYDLLIVEASEQEGITQFITDDMDYAVVSGIQVFTTNQEIIAAAQAKGKLVVR